MVLGYINWGGPFDYREGVGELICARIFFLIGQCFFLL